MKIALIGYGGMGSKYHCESISRIDDLELAGIYDISEARQEAAREAGIHVYASLEEVMQDASVDIVLVATPNDVHEPICIQAMNAGKHVICEKPVSMNSMELQNMIDAANKNNVVFTVHQNRRWDKDFRIMKQIYEEGTLGRVFRIESRVHGSRGIPGDWRQQKEHGGGMILDWGVHLLDQILQMIPQKIKSIYAEVFHVTNEVCDDGFNVILMFENDITVEVQVGTSNFIGLPRWYMLGENGSAVIHDWSVTGKITMVTDWKNKDAKPIVAGVGLTKTMAPRDKDSIQDYPLPEPQIEQDGFYKNVIAAIRGEEESVIGHHELMRVMKLMETIFESAEKNIVITDFEERCKR